MKCLWAVARGGVVHRSLVPRIVHLRCTSHITVHTDSATLPLPGRQYKTKPSNWTNQSVQGISRIKSLKQTKRKSLRGDLRASCSASPQSFCAFHAACSRLTMGLALLKIHAKLHEIIKFIRLRSFFSSLASKFKSCAARGDAREELSETALTGLGHRDTWLGRNEVMMIVGVGWWCLWWWWWWMVQNACGSFG